MTLSARIGDIWRHREVISNFVAQDLKVKYRRSYLGFLWSLLNPLLQMIVLSLVFRLIFRMENISLYLLAGLVPWGFFSGSLDGCAMSIVAAEGMLKRQYFPKLVFPLSIVLQNLITFLLSLLALLLMLGWAIGFRPSAALLILPLSFLCLFCVTLGLGAIAAVVTVYFRDMRHLIGVFLTALFYLTPIIYPLEIKRAAAPAAVSAQVQAPPAGAEDAEYYRRPTVQGPIPHQYRFYFKLNPLYSLMEMFHRPIYDNMLPTASELSTAVGFAVVSLAAGLAVFWRYEDTLVFAL